MSSASTSSAYVLAELEAREYQQKHDYAKAARLAAKAGNIALDHDDPEAWWTMSYLQAECLRDSGSVLESAELAATLVDHPVAQEHDVLRVRALVLLAIAQQGTGQLDAALLSAQAAVKALAPHTDAVDLTIHALQVLIAVYAEGGMMKDAWRECQTLAGLITDVIDESTAGKAYWVIGNVAFLNHQTDDGRTYHDLAARNFSPTTDLDLWAKFNKASAAMRLAAGIVDSGTLRCIERAELATEIIGGSPEDHLLLAIARAHWHYLTGDHPTAIALLEPVCARASDMAAQSAAESFDLLGRSLQASGRPTEALEHLRAAAAYFAEAGATERVVAVEDFISNHFGTSYP